MIFSIKSKEDKFIQKEYNESMKELNKFFKINWKRNKPRIFLMKDRKTINNLRGKETERWIVGWVDNGDIYILDKENYEKESCHKYSNKDYSGLIKHELVHVFFQILSNNKGEPDWLWEGTAMFASQQNDSRMKNKPLKCREFLNYYHKKGSGVYKEAGFAVQFLVDNYGKEKLLLLIKSLKETNSESEFKQRFKEIYGFELKYKNFNSS